MSHCQATTNMSLDVTTLKRIQQKIKDIVFGFIHNETKSNVIDKNIPADIINICVLFYSNGSDEFDADHISPNLILEGNKITKQRVRSTANAFLKRILEKGYHEWKFKVPRYDARSDTLVGIWRIRDEPPLSKSWWHDEKGHAYGLHGRFFGYGCKISDQNVFPCKDNAEIKMILDFDDLSLRFIINGKDYGKCYDIKPGKYRAVVYIYAIGDSVEIVD